MPTFFTVRDIAKRVQRADEDLDAAVYRLRNWTKEGLLKPAGKRSPGTGYAHSYTEAAVIDALILTALTDWGIPAVRAAQYGTAEQTMLAFGRLAFGEARKRRPGVVWLGIVRMPGKAHVRPEHVFIQHPGGKIQHTDHFASVITINITQLLERLV